MHARDAFADLQDRGAAAFDAGAYSPVAGKVRRQRAARAAVASVAGIAVVGAGAYAVTHVGATRSTPPAASSTPDATSTAPEVTSVPTPSPTATAQWFRMPAGARADTAFEVLAERYDVSVAEAEAALLAALPPEAGDPTDAPEGASIAEGWFMSGADLDSATLETAAEDLVGWTTGTLSEAGVARADWLRTLTIASILERELPQGTPEDKAAVARVIENRLAGGMMLQLESPLIYITRADERTVTDDGFVVDSPYNTFMRTGLPPTPIGSPGGESIWAAAHPAEGSWQFFAYARHDSGDGTVLLADDFAQHQQNLVELGLLDPRDVER